MNPNTLCKIGLAFTLITNLQLSAQQTYSVANASQVVIAKWTGNSEGPVGLAPINPQSATFASDIEKSFTIMEQTVETEYAKLTKEAKDDLLATYERIRVIDQRDASLKSQKEQIQLQISKLNGSKSNHSKISNLQKQIIEIDKNLVHCRDNRALLKNQLGGKETETESLLAQLDTEKQNTLTDLSRQRDLITKQVKGMANISADALPAYRSNLANHMNIVQKNYDWQIRARKVNGGFVAKG